MRRKRFIQLDLQDMFSLQSDDTSPLERVERGEQHARLQHAIQHLPEAQREVLLLTFYHQLTGAEIAEVLQISEGTVKSRLHRAKEMLKGLLLQKD